MSIIYVMWLHSSFLTPCVCIMGCCGGDLRKLGYFSVMALLEMELVYLGITDCLTNSSAALSRALCSSLFLFSELELRAVCKALSGV